MAAILAANPGQAIIIEDKNGDQWVVEKEGDGAKVTKVEGGGLTSVNLASITSEEIDLVKKALKELRKDYSDAKVNKIEKELISKKQIVDEYIAANNAQYPKPLAGAEADDEEDYPELIIIETPVEDTNFRDVVGKYKAHEYKLNKAIVIKTFSKDTNSKTEYAIVASGVSINQKNLKEYLAEAAEINKPQDEQVQDIKGAILKFIEEILKNQVYGG